MRKLRARVRMDVRRRRDLDVGVLLLRFLPRSLRFEVCALGIGLLSWHGLASDPSGILHPLPKVRTLLR